jgi:hypothetical protein
MLLALPKRQRLGLIAATGRTIAVLLIYATWVPK